jgi:hypothetical protein
MANLVEILGTNEVDAVQTRYVIFDDGRHSISFWDLDSEMPIGVRVFPADRKVDALAYAAALIEAC